MLKTNRLLLRQWTEDDLASFYDLGRDKDVMAYFPSLLSRQKSDAVGRKIQSLIDARGWGFWAVEIPAQERFIGFVGLHAPRDIFSFSPCIEIGWRLAKKHWGKGYASEAANAALAFAFETLNLNEVVAFTAVGNLRSQAVMEKIGMRDSGQNFMHPEIEPSHPLCEHVLYTISKHQWQHYFR